MCHKWFPPVCFRHFVQWPGKWVSFCVNSSADNLIHFLLSTVCDVLPLIINNHDVRLPANLLYKYLNKAAEFYINYVTRSTQLENQHQGRCKHPTPLLRLALLKSFRSPTPPIVTLWMCASLVVSLKDASRKKVYNNKSWVFFCNQFYPLTEIVCITQVP